MKTVWRVNKGKKNSMHVFLGMRICSVIVICSLLSSGCSSVGSYKSLEEYNGPVRGERFYQSIQYEGIERNPVIIIPGILGSQLIDGESNEIIWGSLEGKELLKALSSRLVLSFGLPMEMGVALPNLTDNIVPGAPLDVFRIKLLGMIPFHVNAYRDMLKAVSLGGYYDPSFKNMYQKNYQTCFQFGYDWRREISENAVELQEFIQEKRAYLQAEYKKRYGIENYNVQFDIVAHSLGGLLVRYYLRYGGTRLPEDGSVPDVTWAGCAYVDKVIMIGVPNAGYVDALLELVDGLSLVKGVVNLEPAVLGTFPSLYELLPYTFTGAIRNAHDLQGVPVDIFDPDVWIRYGWGLADPDQVPVIEKLLPTVESAEVRQEIARDHLRKCLAKARQMCAALSSEEVLPPGVSLHLFVGDAVPTHASASVNMNTGKLTVEEYMPGDGKVTAASALFDRRLGSVWKPFLSSPIQWDSITYLFAGHMGITRSPLFIDNMLFTLLEMPNPESK